MKRSLVLIALMGTIVLAACGQGNQATPTPSAAPTAGAAPASTPTPTVGAPPVPSPTPTVGSAPAPSPSAAGGSIATAVSSPTATGAPASGGGGATAGQLANAGKTVFQQQCQVCHGDQGQGIVAPAIIGPRASPARYGPTAADLYGFISTNMPLSAPGSLSKEQYLAVTTYLLLENGLVSPTQQIDEQSLREIKTER